MFDSGPYAYRDDPLSDAFRGAINAVLRSRVGTAAMFVGLMSVAGIGIWNGLVDIYVAKHGVTEEVRVLNSPRHDGQSGYQVEFAYQHGDQPDTLRIWEPRWQDLRPGIGMCFLANNPVSCGQTNASVNVIYLADSPGVYVVEGSNPSRFGIWLVTVIVFLMAMGCLGNWILLTWTGQALGLPSWSDVLGR